MALNSPARAARSEKPSWSTTTPYFFRRGLGVAKNAAGLKTPTPMKRRGLVTSTNLPCSWFVSWRAFWTENCFIFRGTRLPLRFTVWSHVPKFKPITAPASSTSEAFGFTVASSTKACADGLTNLCARCRNQLHLCSELACSADLRKVSRRIGILVQPMTKFHEKSMQKLRMREGFWLKSSSWQQNESKHWVASQRTTATAIEKTKGVTKSMLEKVKPVTAAAAKAKGNHFGATHSCPMLDRKRWKGKMFVGDYALPFSAQCAVGF